MTIIKMDILVFSFLLTSFLIILLFLWKTSEAEWAVIHVVCGAVGMEQAVWSYIFYGILKYFTWWHINVHSIVEINSNKSLAVRLAPIPRALGWIFGLFCDSEFASVPAVLRHIVTSSMVFLSAVPILIFVFRRKNDTSKFQRWNIRWISPDFGASSCCFF